MAPMLFNSDKKAFVVVETELDACMLYKVTGDIVGVLAIGSAAAKPDRDAYEKGIDLRKWILAGLPPAWHVGPFSLNGEDRGTPTPEEVLSKDTGNKQLPWKPELKGPLEKLYGYLKKYPIKIRATISRLSLIEKPGYYTWETGQRVSQLVFFNDEVFDYLHQHPDDIVSCDNF